MNTPGPNNAVARRDQQERSETGGPEGFLSSQSCTAALYANVDQTVGPHSAGGNTPGQFER